MTFAVLMAAANESKTGRNPGQWTPAACKVWRGADPEDAWLLGAALVWELATGRQVQPADENAIRDRRRQMDEATAAVKTKTAD